MLPEGAVFGPDPLTPFVAVAEQVKIDVQKELLVVFKLGPLLDLHLPRSAVRIACRIHREGISGHGQH